MQDRSPRFRRAPQNLNCHRIGDRALEIISALDRFSYLNTALLLHIVPGNRKVTQRHLHRLYHLGLISRLSRQGGTTSEFVYFLDNPSALELFADQKPCDRTTLHWDRIKRNRQRMQRQQPSSGGHLLFIEHELMISRFHALVELACLAAPQLAQLQSWRQGPEIWSTTNRGNTARMPHRPDAFFTLFFPSAPEGKRHSNFFYEADRNTCPNHGWLGNSLLIVNISILGSFNWITEFEGSARC